MNNTVILIGAMGLKGVVYDGQTFKNRVFLQQFSKHFDKVIPINTTGWKRRPWVLLQLLWSLVWQRRAKVVISTCDENAYRVVKFLYYIRLQKDVFYWVVGGGLQNFFAEGRFQAKYFYFLKQVLVQSPNMKKELCKYGLVNVSYVPNSKIIYTFPEHEYGDMKKFVFVSRIIREKGYGEIIDSVKTLNEEGLRERFTVTFYGLNDEVNDFKERIASLGNVEYKGLLDLRSAAGYKELSSYDVFLFPTYYPNEGFPGVLIDAFIAGLPVIATDWNYNREIIKDGVTGIVIPPKDGSALVTIMRRVINSQYDLAQMSKNARTDANKYDANVVLGATILKEIGLIE